MSRRKRNHPEKSPAASDAARERIPTDDTSGRDESSSSDSSRPVSSGADAATGSSSVSDYLADEIGALDSMRHGEPPAASRSDLPDESDPDASTEREPAAGNSKADIDGADEGQVPDPP